jgi:hypothetical protein
MRAKRYEMAGPGRMFGADGGAGGGARQEGKKMKKCKESREKVYSGCRTGFDKSIDSDRANATEMPGLTKSKRNYLLVACPTAKRNSSWQMIFVSYVAPTKRVTYFNNAIKAFNTFVHRCWLLKYSACDRVDSKL